MKIAIMQPYIYPYMGYYQLIKSVDKFIILDDVNFIKRGWIHRNNLSDNKLFTIPIVRASQNKLILETEYSIDEKWLSKFYKRLHQVYGKTKNYKTIINLIENDITNGVGSISDLNYKTLKTICSYLEIETNIIPTSQIYKINSLKGQDRIISICEKENAKTYINAIGGQNLYDKESFNNKNIELKFIKTNFNSYDSMLTLLMNKDKNNLIKELNNYDLI